MSKVNYCLNGSPVTDQVILFQKTRESSDYLPIQFYYDNYKEVWFNQLKDYMDRSTFDSEYDFKLIRAVDTFDADAANKISNTRGLNYLGNFNRWFYKILTNWKSNVKTSSFRLKKRPSVQCPICGRFVGRIDEEHLKHYMSLSDLPKIVKWKGNIFEVVSKPKVYATTWGKWGKVKWNDLLNGNNKAYQDDKRRTRWPWRLKNGERGVLCPLTKKIIPFIDDQYLQGLNKSVNRYADPFTWDEFIQAYPSALIQNEIYDLEHSDGEGDDKLPLRDKILDKKQHGDIPSIEQIRNGNIPTSFEHAFKSIDVCVKNNTDRHILKMVSAGYSVEEVSEELDIDKKEVRKRMRSIRDSNKELENMLKG